VKQNAAMTIIRRLQASGYEAFLVVGCVRDLILGREPKDFDVTTNARPEQVQALFDKTLAVGASFGVVVVVIDEEQVEVATYRSDGQYSDGRRPDSVEYGKSAREDVERRDFTINGLLLRSIGLLYTLDTVDAGIVDYVGGIADLNAKVIHCIGDPNDRFAEDALRMLRAVRFAAQLNFEIEQGTLEAIANNARKITSVSRERVAAEMFKLLTAKYPVKGIVPLFASGLVDFLFPSEFVESLALGRTLQRFTRFQTNDPVLAMSMFLADTLNPKVPLLMCQNLKLSNDERTKIVTGLLYVTPIQKTRTYNLTPASFKRSMRQPGIENALEIAIQDEVIGKTYIGLEALMSIINDYKKLTQDEIYPKPLVTGDDLIAVGLKPSPTFRTILYQIEEDQLDGVLTDRETALSRALALANLVRSTPVTNREAAEGGA
jgi:tRNA nucleotidyltransferase/poly(A) polymerase